MSIPNHNKIAALIFLTENGTAISPPDSLSLAEELWKKSMDFSTYWCPKADDMVINSSWKELISTLWHYLDEQIGLRPAQLTKIILKWAWETWIKTEIAVDPQTYTRSYCHTNWCKFIGLPENYSRSKPYSLSNVEELLDTYPDHYLTTITNESENFGFIGAEYLRAQKVCLQTKKGRDLFMERYLKGVDNTIEYMES